jgi:4-amino-4-deoxy-L-arabinose transferase-like glycosyltransferase
MDDATADNPSLIGEVDSSVQRRSNPRFLIVGSVALFCFCLATRIPLRSRLLSGWDPVQFAQAIHHFDISHDRPQPPGYIVYVGLAKMLFRLVHDDNLTLTTLSALFSALSTVLIFVLAFSMYDRRTALLASAVWATCPLVWYHGLIGEIYASAGFSSLAVGLSVFLWLTSPSALMAACAGGVYGLATGLRPDQLLLLAPFFLFPFWRSRACRRWAPLAFSSALVVYAAWYIPTVLSAGGYGSYSRLVRTQLSTAVRRENIFFGASPMAHLWMLMRLASGLALGLLPLLVVLAVLWLLRTPNREAEQISGDRALLLVVWAVPFLLFYSLIFIGRVSYCLACLPPLLLLVSRWAVTTLAGPHRDGKEQFWLLLFLAVVVNGGVFFLIPRVPEPKSASNSFKLRRLVPEALNRSMLSCVYDQVRFDQAVKERYFEEIRRLLLQGDSAVLFIQLGPPDCLNGRIFEYYFPKVPFYTALGSSDPIPGFRRPPPLKQGGTLNEARPLKESEGSEPGPTLEVARDRVLMLCSKGLFLEVNGQGVGARVVKTEDRDDRLDIYQVYDLRLTPTSSVEVKAGRQSVSIVEQP